uniref:Uncharacterized protein n=1 Tax=Panagrellus redivivus TaxID=6233 RepID=A0A7E4ZWD7_PANRE
MQSRLIVAICVVGCAFAVQAMPRRRYFDFDPYDKMMMDMYKYEPTSSLMDMAYDKLYNFTEKLTIIDAVALLERLSEFVLGCEIRLFNDHYDIEVEKRIERLRLEVRVLDIKSLVKFVRDKHQAVFKVLNGEELTTLRGMVLNFVIDRNPNIKYYMEKGWLSVYSSAVDETEKQLFEHVSYDLNNIRISPIQKIRLTNKIVKIIKRVDEELAKTNKEEVDKMVARTPYEKLYPLSLYKLSKEARYRVDALAGNALDENSTYLKTALIDFIDVVEEITKVD